MKIHSSNHCIVGLWPRIGLVRALLLLSFKGLDRPPSCESIGTLFLRGGVRVAFVFPPIKISKHRDFICF